MREHHGEDGMLGAEGHFAVRVTLLEAALLGREQAILGRDDLARPVFLHPGDRHHRSFRPRDRIDRSLLNRGSRVKSRGGILRAKWAGKQRAECQRD